MPLMHLRRKNSRRPIAVNADLVCFIDNPIARDACVFLDSGMHIDVAESYDDVIRMFSFVTSHRGDTL
jgi:hypothetical protein